MIKEIFSDRVGFYKQQNEPNGLDNIFSRKQNQRNEEEGKIIERVDKTKEIFKGTGILEAFQEIIDKRILLFAKVNEIRYEQTLFNSNKRVSNEEKIPAKIGFHFNEINLIYNAKYHVGTEHESAHYRVEKIKVIKKGKDGFKLKFPPSYYNGLTCNTERIIKDRVISANEVISNIANFIANNDICKNTETFNYDIKNPTKNSIMELSKKYNRKSGIPKAKYVPSLD